MLDIKFIRDNKELVDMAAKKKRIKFNIDELLKFDDKRRELIQEVDKKRAEQNEFSQRIASITDTEGKNAVLLNMKKVKQELKEREFELEGVMKNWQKLMLQVPNIPDMSVPDGAGDEENQEVKKWGEPTKFSFAPKSHIELVENLDLADFKKGSDVAGFRGYFLKNEAAKLSLAILNYGLNFFESKGGFVPMVVPSLVRKETLFGTGYLPQGEDDLYRTQDEDYLAGTGEVATMAYFADTTLSLSDLPKKMLSFSPCYRREAGSHGKDTKGLVRVHEFYKLEQVILCEASHEESVKWHEWLNRNTEEFIESLGIPYRTVVNCTGDLGQGQVKKYDVELWVPSENKYREISSASYFHDFQTRRLGIKYKDKEGKTRYAHSLNCTAVPTPRILVALFENNQQADGSIKIPKVLVPYMGKDSITRA